LKRMRSDRKGVSTTVAAVVIVVVFVIAGVGGYLLQSGGAGTSKSSSASTVTSSSFTTTSSSSIGSSLSTTSTSTTSTTSTSAASSNPGGPNQTAVMAGLAAAAKAECAQQTSTCLTIYTTQDAGNWAEYYGPAFYQQYPWAQGKVVYTSLSASDETTDLLSQYQAHGVIADIATGTLAPLIPVYQAGGFLNYTSPEVQFMNYTADAVGPAWVVTDLAIVHMIYNPNLLPANEVPKNWSDLANPIFKGKLVFQSPSSLSITAAEFYYLYTSLGNSSGQWNALMKGIAANHPALTSTAGSAEAAVLNGQAVLGIDTLDSYVTALKGDPSAPLKIVDIEPLVYTPGVVAITNGAPHPAMAKLVEAWFISAAGQKAVYETNHLPYQTSLGTPLLAYLPADYRLVDAYSTYSNTTLFQNTGQWSDTFDFLFQG
jgi:iron(III) transport system substrate-binding protein